jgi:hypothetical protein
MADSPPLDLRLPLHIAAIALLLGIPPIWPYGYYIFLRLIVCVIAGYSAYRLKGDNPRLFWLMVLVALLFNPIALVALPKLLWVPIDLSCALLFFALAKRFKST